MSNPPLWRMSSSTGCCFISYHSSSLLKNFRVWPASSEAGVDENLDYFHGSGGGSGFTMMLKTLVLVLMLISEDRQTFLSWRKAALAFSHLHLSPLPVNYFALLFSPLMLRPKLAGVSTMMLVFSCFCCWVWERTKTSNFPRQPSLTSLSCSNFSHASTALISLNLKSLLPLHNV